MIQTSDAQYALDLCARIATHTDVPNTITRTFLSPATHGVHALLTAEMQALGMTIRTDSAGNLRGLYPAANPAAETPVLLLGSHIDTVPNAGRYDGILGVAIPLALIRALAGRKLPCAIELIAFSEEEGVRYKLPFLGSRALTGRLGPAELARTDATGITLAQAIRNFGLNPDNLADAVITPRTFAFLEVHIEQGPILESLALPLGVVETIVAQSRFELTFTGQANHAGTTPMHLRHDALAAAAVFITAAETIAQNTPHLVATVGTIHASPGAANIIPGAVTCSLDIRHPDDATLDLSAQALLAEAATLAESRGVTLATRATSAQSSVPLDPTLRAALIAAAEAHNLQPHSMTSGAGHDAMILAPHVPAAMLFLRTPAGLSHHPDESVSLEDVEAALKTCMAFLETIRP